MTHGGPGSRRPWNDSRRPWLSAALALLTAALPWLTVAHPWLTTAHPWLTIVSLPWNLYVISCLNYMTAFTKSFQIMNNTNCILALGYFSSLLPEWPGLPYCSSGVFVRIRVVAKTCYNCNSKSLLFLEPRMAQDIRQGRLLLIECRFVHYYVPHINTPRSLKIFICMALEHL